MSKFLPLIGLLSFSSLFSQKDSIILLDTLNLRLENRFELRNDFTSKTLNFAEELELKTPVFIKNYGAGNLATVSYQGSTSSQNSLFWEGLNLTPINSGTVDYSLIDAFLFSAYSFQSSQNTLQGSGIGADIVLENKLKPDSVWHSSNFIGLGSFNDTKLGLKWEYGSKKSAFSLALLGANAKNNFKFYNPIKKDFERRENNRNEFVSSMLGYEYYGKKILWSFKSWNRFSDREIPSPVHVSNQREKQSDLFSRNLLSATCYLPKNWKWNQALAYLYENYQYENPESKVEGFGELNRLNYNTKFEKSLTKKLNAVAGFYTDVVFAYISEQAKKRCLMGFSGEMKYVFSKLWQSTFSLRKEFYADEKDLPFASNCSVAFTPKNFRFYLKGHKNARKPTLNDLHWKNGGNPNLTSENSKTVYFGIQRSGKLSIQTEFFVGNVQDLILWLPNASNGLWQPSNVSAVQRFGFNTEIKKKIEFSKSNLEIASLFALTHSEDERKMQLIYVPIHQFKTWFIYRNSNAWEIQSDFQVNGMRYVAKDHTAFLPKFMVADLSISKEFSWLRTASAKISFAVKNLTNYTYYNIPFRPMPGRYFGLSLQTKF